MWIKKDAILCDSVFSHSIGVGFKKSGHNVIEVERGDGTTLLWSSAPFKLSAKDAIISNIENLSDSNHRLLCQLVGVESE